VKLIEVKEPPKEVPKQIVEPPKEVPKEIVEPPKEVPKPKEEPKVEIKPAAVVIPQPEVPKTIVGKKMTLIESTYVRKNPTLDVAKGGKTLVWLFNKNEEVVIISQADRDWVEVKNTMGRKGFIKLDNLKEMN
jgi:hypothetical protein